MPKTTKKSQRRVNDNNGYAYVLTKTTLREVATDNTDPHYYIARLSTLKDGEDTTVKHTDKRFGNSTDDFRVYITRGKFPEVKIGCRVFSSTNARRIIRAINAVTPKTKKTKKALAAAA